ncbi:hypothetical protein GYMLUDRAFT_244207 [Collybiopsis luxurians FD-317 M1]|uniref:Uncharacterized protein n=1 Tax=Collybiopsis luxurians FD-317 M1 TaxID=944289 RepID=A0A0D0BY19_9AGAR|nr:hypothetical protein GYMLUDRAFT_244207 [Collybiopsis luxurians FD-317 M1]
MPDPCRLSGADSYGLPHIGILFLQHSVTECQEKKVDREKVALFLAPLALSPQVQVLSLAVHCGHFWDQKKLHQHLEVLPPAVHHEEAALHSPTALSPAQLAPLQQVQVLLLAVCHGHLWNPKKLHQHLEVLPPAVHHEEAALHSPTALIPAQLPPSQHLQILLPALILAQLVPSQCLQVLPLPVPHGQF